MYRKGFRDMESVCDNIWKPEIIKCIELRDVTFHFSGDIQY